MTNSPKTNLNALSQNYHLRIKLDRGCWAGKILELDGEEIKAGSLDILYDLIQKDLKSRQLKWGFVFLMISSAEKT